MKKRFALAVIVITAIALSLVGSWKTGTAQSF